MPTRNFGFRGPRNLRLGARCIVVDRESLSHSIKQFLQCKSTIKSAIYFTAELKEGLENLNESRRVLSRSP